jgi:hypothetical protein
MPALRNIRHEKFCLALVAGIKPRQAHIEAGYPETHNSGTSASHLKQNPIIKARLAELLEEKFEYHRNAFVSHEDVDAVAEFKRTGVISKEWIIAQLMRNALEAAKEKQLGASNQALSWIGRALGLFDKGAGKDLEAPKITEVYSGMSVPTINLMLEDMGILERGGE